MSLVLSGSGLLRQGWKVDVVMHAARNGYSQHLSPALAMSSSLSRLLRAGPSQSRENQRLQPTLANSRDSADFAFMRQTVTERGIPTRGPDVVHGFGAGQEAEEEEPKEGAA